CAGPRHARSRSRASTARPSISPSSPTRSLFIPRRPSRCSSPEHCRQAPHPRGGRRVAAAPARPGRVHERRVRPAACRARGAAAAGREAMKLLIATRNDGKVREIRDIFVALPFQLVFPADQFLERLPEEQDLERGSSFSENAVAKARYFAARSHLPTLAEDS